MTIQKKMLKETHFFYKLRVFVHKNIISIASFFQMEKLTNQSKQKLSETLCFIEQQKPWKLFKGLLQFKHKEEKKNITAKSSIYSVKKIKKISSK